MTFPFGPLAPQNQDIVISELSPKVYDEIMGKIFEMNSEILESKKQQVLTFEVTSSEIAYQHTIGNLSDDIAGLYDMFNIGRTVTKVTVRHFEIIRIQVKNYR